MLKKSRYFLFLFFLLAINASAQKLSGINLEGIDPAQLARLFEQGNMVLVKTNPDGTLKEVVAGALVNAPLDVVWEVINDYPHYPEFMPQTTAEKIVEKKSATQLITEQTVEIKIWLIKVHLTYQLLHKLEPKRKIRFTHYAGDLPGTSGGWDLLPVPETNQTIIFYLLYSNLTSLSWPVGSIMKSQPDFFTAVNVSTATLVVKAVKKESEKRAQQEK